MTRTELTELWNQRMNDFETSGLTGTQWCAKQNIKLNQFRYWRRKLRMTRPAHLSNGNWATLQIEDKNEDHESLLVHYGHARIEVRSGFNPDLLADVIRVLHSL